MVFWVTVCVAPVASMARPSKTHKCYILHVDGADSIDNMCVEMIEYIHKPVNRIISLIFPDNRPSKKKKKANGIWCANAVDVCVCRLWAPHAECEPTPYFHYLFIIYMELRSLRFFFPIYFA